MERLVGTPGRSEGIDKAVLLAALDDATAALRDGDVTFLVMGGIASAAFGRPRRTWDIDLLDDEMLARSVTRSRRRGRSAPTTAGPGPAAAGI